MPATAGRVKMPQDNRMSVSDSLRTSEIWQKSIGFDPYAPLQQETSEVGEADEVNERAKNIFTLARLTGNSSAAIPGSCKKCGQVGHLPFQCRNLLQLKPEGESGPQSALKADEESDDEAEAEARRRLGLLSDSSDDEGEIRRKRRVSSTNEESSSESDSGSSSSDDSRKKSKKRKRDKKKKQKKKKDVAKSKRRTSDTKEAKKKAKVSSSKRSRKRRKTD